MEFRQRQDQSAATIQRMIVIGIVVIGGIFVLYEASTMFYRVDASEEGVVLRFGQHVRKVTSGLHMKWPYPVETVYRVPVDRVQSLEFGFRTAQAGRVTRYASRTAKHEDEAEMLTGDLNLAHVEWVVQYRIKDSYAALFNLGGGGQLDQQDLPSGVSTAVNPAIPDTIRDVAETVMRKLCGDTSVDAVLTSGRNAIADQARIEMQTLLDGFDSGVEIVTVQLQTTAPPDQVGDAFQEVNRARQNKERIVNEAEGERNRQIPAAFGKKDQAISEAEGYRESKILETRGRTAAFEAQLAEYEKAPEITRMRLYLEAMEEVFAGVDEKIIIDDSVGGGVLPVLDLESEGGTRLPMRAKGGSR